MIPALDALPLVLAGPIVRAVSQASATVWIATKEATPVNLHVFGPGSSGEVLRGTQQTRPIGEHLHVAVVTATPVSAGNVLPWGAACTYTLQLGSSDLFAEGVVDADATRARSALCYSAAASALPGFVVPPASPDDLRILHGSSRKPHGIGHDALAAADAILRESDERPHQLFLTGNQIYADDVADALLAVLTDAGDVLLGWPELLPGAKKMPSELPPGCREPTARAAGITSRAAASHLFGLGEYCAMFLASVAPTLWPEALPSFQQVHADEHKTWKADSDAGIVPARYAASKAAYELDIARLALFQRALEAVRRVLANVATYMTFDEHDVSDGWYRSLEWCSDVLASPLGTRVVQNALGAFAVCCAWGNTPERFAAGTQGGAALDRLVGWSASHGTSTDDEQALAQALGIPTAADVERERAIPHNGDSLEWHFALPAAQHDVVVLDSRTWREFPLDRRSAVMGDAGFARQLDALPPQPGRVSIIVSATPALDHSIVRTFDGWSPAALAATAAGGDSWSAVPAAAELLLRKLATRASTSNDPKQVIILSGGGRYATTMRARYRLLTSERVRHAEILQFVAAPLRDELPRARALHVEGRVPLGRLERAGWINESGERRVVGSVADAARPKERTAWTVGGTPAVASWMGRLVERDGVAQNAAWAQIETTPDWLYEVEVVEGVATNRPLVLDPVRWPDPADAPATVSAAYAPAARNVDRLRAVSSGTSFITSNTLTQIVFDPGESGLRVTGYSWWLETDDESEGQWQPLTTFIMLLPEGGDIYPAVAPLDASVRFMIRGRSLRSDATVMVGEQPAKSLAANPSGTTLYGTAPASAAGVADVVVSSGGVTTTYPGALVYSDDAVAVAAAATASYEVRLRELLEQVAALVAIGAEIDAAVEARLRAELELAGRSADLAIRPYVETGADAQIAEAWRAATPTLRSLRGDVMAILDAATAGES
jgi:hypothetical protein